MPVTDRVIINFSDFFRWCSEQGITRTRDIARAFGRTPQTIENWRKKAETDSTIPLHVELSCIGYEAIRNETGLIEPISTPLTLTLFHVWRQYYGLGTLEKTAEAFGLTRQAVHNWYIRKRLPKWLNLACHGYAHLQNDIHSFKHSRHSS